MTTDAECSELVTVRMTENISIIVAKMHEGGIRVSDHDDLNKVSAMIAGIPGWSRALIDFTLTMVAFLECGGEVQFILNGKAPGQARAVVLEPARSNDG